MLNFAFVVTKSASPVYQLNKCIVISLG